MGLPITGSFALVLALIFGGVFGVLLHRGRVADYNVIVNLFRFKDFTVLKVMLTAIVVGGIGVWALHGVGLTQYHIKTADLLAVTLGAALFGVGMVLYGFCPGTGVAAIATGSLDALIGAVGMIAGGIAYAYSYDWIKANILGVGALGKVRLPEVTGVPEIVWFVLLTAVALLVFRALEKSPTFKVKE